MSSASTCAKLSQGGVLSSLTGTPSSCAWLADGKFVCADNDSGDGTKKGKRSSPHQYILRPVSRFDYGAYKEKNGKNDDDEEEDGEMSLAEFVHRRYAQGYPLKSETTGGLVVDSTPFDIKLMKKAAEKCGSCKKSRCNHCGLSYGGCKYCGMKDD